MYCSSKIAHKYFVGYINAGQDIISVESTKQIVLRVNRSTPTAQLSRMDSFFSFILFSSKFAFYSLHYINYELSHIKERQYILCAHKFSIVTWLRHTAQPFYIHTIPPFYIAAGVQCSLFNNKIRIKFIGKCYPTNRNTN